MEDGVRAGDIMVPLGRYPSVRPEAKLREAIALLERPELAIRLPDGRVSLPRVLLVIDDTMNLVGLLRRRDIFRAILPRFLRGAPGDPLPGPFEVPADPNLASLVRERRIDRMRHRAERRVRAVMSPVRVTVDHDDHLLRILQEMVDHDLPLIPVLEDGEVVGAVRSVDVLHHVARRILLRGG